MKPEVFLNDFAQALAQLVDALTIYERLPLYVKPFNDLLSTLEQRL